MSQRKCWDCGNVAEHESDIAPGVCCKLCGSQDTRIVKGRTLINDGQLDHANREIEALRNALEASCMLSTVLFGVAKEVSECGISQTLGRYHEVQIPLDLWDQIRDMTDESEVQP